MPCTCAEATRPIRPPEGSNQRPRQWFVARRNWICSAFNGYRRQYSNRSDVYCRVCGVHWRSEARWVHKLPDCEFFASGKNPPIMPPAEA